MKRKKEEMEEEMKECSRDEKKLCYSEGIFTPREKFCDFYQKIISDDLYFKKCRKIENGKYYVCNELVLTEKIIGLTE